VLPFAGGCYKYTRVPIEAAPVGADVRLIVNRAGVPQLSGMADSDDVAPSVTGQLAGREGGALRLRVPLTSVQQPGQSSLDLAQMLEIPQDQVLSLELQRIDPVRTGLLVGGGVAAAAFVLYKIIDAYGSDGGDGGDGPILFDLIEVPIG
jgi:hypothetical protein